MDNGTLTSGDLFGTRRAMKNNYLNRWLGTIGIYGNSKQEALYPIYRIDADGQKLSGANRYRIRFAPGQLLELRPSLPPWSIVVLWRKDVETEPVRAFIAAALGKPAKR